MINWTHTARCDIKTCFQKLTYSSPLKNTNFCDSVPNFSVHKTAILIINLKADLQNFYEAKQIKQNPT